MLETGFQKTKLTNAYLWFNKVRKLIRVKHWPPLWCLTALSAGSDRQPWRLAFQLRIIVVSFSTSNNFRNPLVISVSEDEGFSWNHTHTLEYAKETDSVEFSYPTLFQDITGRIHVSYTYNRDTIKYKIIPNEAWILNRT